MYLYGEKIGFQKFDLEMASKRSRKWAFLEIYLISQNLAKKIFFLNGLHLKTKKDIKLIFFPQQSS